MKSEPSCVELTAALAKKGLAEAVVISICDEAGLDRRTAELVIGQLRSQLRQLSMGNRTSATPYTPSPDDCETEFDYDLGVDLDGFDTGTGLR